MISVCSCINFVRQVQSIAEVNKLRRKVQLLSFGSLVAERRLNFDKKNAVLFEHIIAPITVNLGLQGHPDPFANNQDFAMLLPDNSLWF